MSFKIKSFIAQNGERFSQLYSGAEAFPLFYRNRSPCEEIGEVKPSVLKC